MIKLIISGFFLLVNLLSNAQEAVFDRDDFRISGNSFYTENDCFRLTSATYWQGGSVWHKESLDLTQPFSLEMKVFLGCDDAGADGIVFILHPFLTTGFAGEGMGFGGLYPALGVEMDTYRNYHLGDPAYDHTALVYHGRLNHRFGDEPIALSTQGGDVEDCIPHLASITWDPKKNDFRFYFDGQLRIHRQIDLVKDVFSGNPEVYWGFSSATGDKFNRQEICLERITYSVPFTLSNMIKSTLEDGKSYTLSNADFASGQSRLPDRARTELDKLADYFKTHPSHSIIIDGHTDSSGSADNNQRLSTLRARAVAQYLISRGIDSKRILYFGQGETNPIAPNNTSAGRKQNRRIELKMRILKV